MLTRSIGTFHPPESFKFEKPRLVQRMRMLSKNNQVRLSERFAFDYMGASEFEQGSFAKRVRELNDSCHVGEILVSGRPMYAAWNPNTFNSEGAEFVINRVWDGSLRTHERTNFSEIDYKKWKEDVRRQRENPLVGRSIGFMADSWFDINHGLFWTWVKCNIADFRLNVNKSVAYMDEKKATA